MVILSPLCRNVSTRFAAYDDKTGKPITPTTVLVGKAHIGVGFDLEAPGAQAIVTGVPRTELLKLLATE